MKIYTYYEPISHAKKFKRQLELIDLWKKSWELNGFEPIVLSREDAMKSDAYTEYYDFIQRVNKKISGQELPERDYWLAAQLEIVAFTTIKEFGFISDYDVINYNFKPIILKEDLHWLNGACSCFAYGRSIGWYNYIQTLFKNEDKIVEFCKERFFNKNGREYYGDQDFLQALLHNDVERAFTVTYDKSLAQMYIPRDDISNNKTYHISHDNVRLISPHINQDDARIKYAKEIIENIGTLI